MNIVTIKVYISVTVQSTTEYIKFRKLSRAF